MAYDPGLRNGRYYVRIHTADVADAGTDAAVYATIIGEEGQTPETELDNIGNDFERGSTSGYSIPSPHIGRPLKIRLRHNNGGLRPGWRVGSISVSRTVYAADDEASLAIERDESSDKDKPAFSSLYVGYQSGTVDTWLATDSGGIDKTFDLTRVVTEPSPDDFAIPIGNPARKH
ncbi:PLAT/LH2 domain-containing protein [Streptomyces sp. NPDC003032]